MRVIQTKDTLSEIYVDAMRIRHQVFMVEQGVPFEEEVDQYEALCVHFVLYDDDKKALATCRLLPLENGVMKLQRMAVIKEARGKGYGELIVTEAETFAKTQGYNTIKLGAQLTALGFYEKLGYTAYGEEFLDANIPHMMMEKRF